MSGPATVFPLLATRLLAANPSPSAALTEVITKLSKRFGPADCPIAVIRMAPDTDNEYSSETTGQPGLARDKYHARILIFLGVYTGPDMADQLDDTSKPWPQAVGAALIADMTLGGAVAFIGDDSTQKLFTYQLGVIPWIDGNNYWGMTVTLPITEKISTNVG